MKFSKFFLTILFVFIIVLTSLPTYADEAAEKPVICIDPGHGGIDGGTDAGTKTEKEYNLALSLALRDALVEDGRFEVVMTREDDTYLKYLARADIARRANADLLLSMHCNQVDEDYVTGTQAFVSLIEKYNAASLAGSILDSIESAVGLKRGKVLTRADSGDSLGVYYWNSERQWDMPGAEEYGQISDYFSMNTWSSKFGIPSIIIEHGYLSNAGDLAILNSDASIKAIAKAEAAALAEYYFGHEHTFVKSVDYPSNCVFAGTVSDRCSVCGMKTNTAALPENPDGHFWRTTESTPATCTADGHEHCVCQISFNLNAKGYDCEVHEEDSTIPALGHDYHTVTSDGRTVRKCTGCGDEIYTLCTTGGDHLYEIVESATPTCTVNGKKVYRCTVCGDEYTEDIHAEGHKYEITEEQPATDSADGFRKYVCTVCGNEYTEVLSNCSHQYATEVVETTCTEDGHITKICFLCGHTETTVLESAGHVIAEDTRESVLPTCTEDGYVRGVCEVCGETVTEPIPAEGHKFYDSGRYEICPACGEKHLRPFIDRATDNPVMLASGIIAVAAVAAIIIIITQNARARKAKKARRNALKDEWSKIK